MVAAGNELREAAAALDGSPEREERFRKIFQKLLDTESHYTREENVLFPYLEKHGITEPPAVMWMEHDQIRAIKKAIKGALEREEGRDRLLELATGLADAMMSHFDKENKILFPTAMETIGEAEWREIRSEFDGIGYCCVTPPPMPADGTGARPAGVRGAEIELPTGRLTVEELAGLSDRIQVEVRNFVTDRPRVEEFGIDKIPAIAVLGEGDRDYGIRFFGVPAGYEFSSLLEAIKMVASGDSGLSPEAREALRGLKKPVHIQVFVTLTCPYCPMAVQLAHRCAVESELVRADMVEAAEFPHLANRYGVYAVPKVVMNEGVSFEGALPEKAFVDYLLTAGS